MRTKKRKFKSILIGILACILMSCHISFATETDALDTEDTTDAAADTAFAGWNDETKEDAWDVFTSSDWSEFKSLILFDGSQQSIDVNVSFKVKGYEEKIKEVLSNSSWNLSSPNEDYTKLIMGIIQELSGSNPSEPDICSVQKYIYPNRTVTTPEESIQLLFSRLAQCELFYNSTYSDNPVDVYHADKRLQSVIQSVILTSQYSAENEKYSKKSAKEFYNSHKDTLFKDTSKAPANFANKVLNRYSAVSIVSSSGGGNYTYDGTVTDAMKKVVKCARNNISTYDTQAKYCARWVRGVYQKAGYPYNGLANAIDYWTTWQSTGSSSPDNIPPGAVVIGSGSGSAAGNQSGHVGIYLGDGMVADNIGRHRICSLDEWMKYNKGTCRGYHGFVGWVWPGGTPLT